MYGRECEETRVESPWEVRRYQQGIRLEKESKQPRAAIAPSLRGGRLREQTARMRSLMDGGKTYRDIIMGAQRILDKVLVFEVRGGAEVIRGVQDGWEKSLWPLCPDMLNPERMSDGQIRLDLTRMENTDGEGDFGMGDIY